MFGWTLWCSVRRLTPNRLLGSFYYVYTRNKIFVQTRKRKIFMYTEGGRERVIKYEKEGGKVEHF